MEEKVKQNSLKYIKDEQGNVVPTKDFCFLVTREERQIIREAINEERGKKGWPLVRQKYSCNEIRQEQLDNSNGTDERRKNNKCKMGKFVIRITVAERVIAANAVNAERSKKGLTLLKLQAGTEKWLYPRREHKVV